MWSIFSWFIYRVFKFLAIATSFFSYEFILVEFIFLFYLFIVNFFELIFFFFGITYGIFPRKIPMEWCGKFFFVFFPSINPLVIIFLYYQQTFRRIKSYRWKIHRHNIFVCDFVSKLITNRMIVQILT